MKSSDIVVRKAEPNDLPFIMATWLKGLLFGGSDYFRKIPKDIYYANHHKVIENTLLSPFCTGNVAVLKDSPDVILGYIVYRIIENKAVVDWAFTKKDWRNIGILKKLLPSNVVAVTSLTRVGESILTKNPNVVFNPYI